MGHAVGPLEDQPACTECSSSALTAQSHSSSWQLPESPLDPCTHNVSSAESAIFCSDDVPIVGASTVVGKPPLQRGSYEVTHSATVKLMNESKVLRAIEPEASASSPPICRAITNAAAAVGQDAKTSAVR
jgi:hypothetical protein